MAIALSVLVLSGCGGAARGAPDSTSPEGPPAAAPTAVPAVSVASGPTGGAPAPTGADPLRGQQWGLDTVRIDAAWTLATGRDTVIAVVDTGVDATHPDLQGRLVAGVDLVDSTQTSAVDPNGHGTHVAGIAAAATSNEVGVAGAARDSVIMPVRVLDASGAGNDEVIAEGIEWAVANGADVINLSLGESGFVARLSKNGPLNAAIRAADSAGVVVVAAAGNDGNRRQSYRVGVPVVVVSASTQDGAAASFSTVGDVRAVAAPGVGILSTAPLTPTTLWPQGSSGYEALDGTSMASPLVAGTAALLVQQGLSPQQVRDRLGETAVNPTADPALGSGIVDAAAAVGATAPAAAPSGQTTTPPAAPGAAGDGAAPSSRGVPLPDTATGGPGTLTVALTEPVAVDAAVATTVSCDAGARRYTAGVQSASVGAGYAIGATVTVPGYNGPGTYPAAVVVTVSSNGSTTPVPVTAEATIADDLSGSTTFAAPAGSVVSVAGSLGWVCS